MKGKILGTLFGLFAVLMISACTSMTPVTANSSFPSDGKYEILGRVSVSTGITNSGYSKLLAEAKKQYPAADDVVNIMVDRKQTTLLFIFKMNTYEMSGLAVDYK
ncbi:hypothetical protein [Treponema sp.]|uniref:hypothetical protein n=1 Tax=Treponema sp. TaxID=166 RepID=UPI003EFE418C